MVDFDLWVLEWIREKEGSWTWHAEKEDSKK